MQFSIVKRGYCPEEVDKYIKELTYSLAKYKEKDAAIANAIVNAQVSADNIIMNAKLASEEKIRETVAMLDGIQHSIGKQRDIVRSFQEEYYELVAKYLKNTQTTDFLDIFEKIDELESFMTDLKAIDEKGTFPTREERKNARLELQEREASAQAQAPTATAEKIENKEADNKEAENKEIDDKKIDLKEIDFNNIDLKEIDLKDLIIAMPKKEDE